jgi:glycolate oxidase iron-sulfur subunit
MAGTSTIEAAPPRPGFSGADKPVWDDYALCVHCGLCLNHCPTYRLWGMEADSPRGRIRQILLVDQGRLGITETFVTHIDRCLDCRACETACPSGVPYGKLVESARAQIEQKYHRGFFASALRSLVYDHLLPHPRRIAFVARLLRFYQRSGAQALARKSGVLRRLGLEQREKLLPPIESEFFFSNLGKTYPAQGSRRARVAFFAGCVAQVAFAKLNEATIRVLTTNGCEVVVPKDQVCCGALACHAGVRDVARELAVKNMDAFAREQFDAIITNTAGCGSTLKEYDQLFPSEEPKNQRGEHRGAEGTKDAEKSVAANGDSPAHRARQFQSKVRDLTEFLAEMGITAPLKETKLRVTYQDSCHLVHGQRVKDAPRKLITAIPGVELVEMPLSDQCCGSAGVYNVTQTEASMALLEEKMRHAAATKADVIVTANPGCILQLRAGAALHGTGQEVLHVVELLDRAI